MENNQSRFRSLLNGEEGAVIRQGLETSSMSAMDAENRAKNWDKVFSNLDEIVEDRNYATSGSPGYSSAGLHGIEFFDATVAAMIKSYAGIFSVERAMDQPNASLPYMNLYGVKTGALISPNIGVSNTFVEADGYVSKNLASADPTAANTVVNTAGGDVIIDAIPMVPGSLKITATEGANVYVITDNGAGGLNAGPGVLEVGTVDYGLSNNLPVITLKAGATIGANATDFVIEFVQDTPKTINEKIKPELEYYNASTSPIIVPYEINQVANLSAKKALGIDMRQLTLGQITDEYTKVINKKTVDGVTKSASSLNEVTVDVSEFTIATSDYRTYLESFMAQLMMVDTAMAKKTEKGVKVSAYLVSLNLGDIFNQLEMISSKWVPNKGISYVDDVVGYYNGVPVVRSKHVTDANGTDELQGFAIHKTKEGQLAPLMRGIFLPLTNMDEVGSFDNPLLKSGGIFSYEGVSMLTQDLTIGFQVKTGTGTVIS